MVEGVDFTFSSVSETVSVVEVLSPLVTVILLPFLVTEAMYEVIALPLASWDIVAIKVFEVPDAVGSATAD